MLGCNTLSPKRSAGLQNPSAILFFPATACRSGAVIADTSHPQRKGHQQKKAPKTTPSLELLKFPRFGSQGRARVLVSTGSLLCPQTQGVSYQNIYFRSAEEGPRISATVVLTCSHFSVELVGDPTLGLYGPKVGIFSIP